ncbi:MAG: OmpA family protein [Spirochaeta sp.]
MKIKDRKILILIGIELVLFLTIVVVILLLQSQGRAFVRSPVVLIESPTITYLVGKADIQTNPTRNEWRELAIGDSLGKGDTLRTGSDSRLDIRFSDGTAIRLEQNTTLSLSSLDSRLTELKIESGSIFGRFRKRFLEQEYRVRDSNTAAGVRGTKLAFHSDGTNTRIDVYSGIVDVYLLEQPDRVVQLYPGMRTTASPGHIPADPVPIPADEQQAAEHLLRNIQFEQVLLVSSSIQFESNTDRIMPESMPELEWVVQELADSSYRIRIDGHTAEVGTTAAMQKLSLQRAERRREYLVAQGISPNRLQVRGFGSTRPVTGNNTPEGRAVNRRVEFIITDW